MDLTPVASSNIAAVGYDAASAELHILFHTGHLYAYWGVPYDLYAGLMQAPSKGRFFHWYIRWRYHGFQL